LDIAMASKAQVKDRIRKLISMQRCLNEQIYLFSMETSDLETQRLLSDMISRGNKNILSFARLLAYEGNG
jgi:hypothetical protein